MNTISESTNNIFLLWEGDPKEKLPQINACLNSVVLHQPKAQIHLFSNILVDYQDFPAACNDVGVRIHRWRHEELCADSPLEKNTDRLSPTAIRNRIKDEGYAWACYSDFFRYIALWRWGGSWLDIDDLLVRPLPSTQNLLAASIGSVSRFEEGFGELVILGPYGQPPSNYVRINSTPLINFRARHTLLQKCLEECAERVPELLGARTLTDICKRYDGEVDVSYQPLPDVLLHPDTGVLETAAQRFGWPKEWWWEKLSFSQYMERWRKLFGTFDFFNIKNSGYRNETGDHRLLSSWIMDNYREPSHRSSPIFHKPQADGVSVVIPTYMPRNLEKTLSGLAGQSHSCFEVVLVENGCRSEVTRQALVDYSSRLDLRYTFLEDPGLNRARNQGVLNARYPIVALLDDDCIPSNNWIETIRTQHAALPGAGVIGGRVALEFEATPQPWLKGEFRELLSELDWGPEARELSEHEWLVGANMSFRRSVFRRSGGFTESIGMCGRESPQLCLDESEFCSRVGSFTDPGLFYSSDIHVNHYITADRTCAQYMLSRQWGQGLSQAMLVSETAREPRCALIETFWMKALDLTWCDRAKRDGNDLAINDRSAFLKLCVQSRFSYLNGLLKGLNDIVGTDTTIRSLLGSAFARGNVLGLNIPDRGSLDTWAAWVKNFARNSSPESLERLSQGACLLAAAAAFFSTEPAIELPDHDIYAKVGHA